MDEELLDLSDEIHLYKDVDHAFINTLIRGDVSSLTWFESPNQFFEDTCQKNSSLELCHVYYSAINFRDVMLAYGRLPPDAIPGQVRHFVHFSNDPQLDESACL